MMSSEHSAAKVGEIFNKAGAAFTHLGELCLQVYTATDDFREYERSQIEGGSKDATFGEISTPLKSSAGLGTSLDCPQETCLDHQFVASTSDMGSVLAQTSDADVDVVGIADR